MRISVWSFRHMKIISKHLLQTVFFFQMRTHPPFQNLPLNNKNAFRSTSGKHFALLLKKFLSKKQEATTTAATQTPNSSNGEMQSHPGTVAGAHTTTYQSQSKPNLRKALLALIWKNLRKTIMLFQQEAQSSPWRNNKSSVNISWVASHNLQGFF